ncbi:MAG: hypothetical protein LUG16_03400, partial [Candidatus Gastranaerophilales bacterium]|nr:hypothetical protein [Candidatus Gastranaerophilales bacterium]
KLIKSNGEYLFIFDLNSPEMYERKIEEKTGKTKISRTPIFPESWKNQFGLPVEEHRKQLQINIFDGYTVFGLKNTHEKQTSNISENLNEEVNYEQQ